MYLDFVKKTQELGLRGWRLQSSSNQLYLSKFDDHFNDDEFRFYVLFDHQNSAYISKMEKHKTNLNKIMKVKPSNEYIPVARSLCSLLKK